VIEMQDQDGRKTTNKAQIWQFVAKSTEKQCFGKK